MIRKENVYVCTTIEAARNLFNIFKEIKLDYLAEKTFFLHWEEGKENVGFMIRYNTWQVVPLEYAKKYMYNIKINIENIENL